ncbi:MAG: barstar family protein [Geminicoccaceae bacterium]
MKICTLDGRQRSKKAVLARIARDLDFPPHFGGNLDALFDVLTTDLAGPITIRWRPTANARKALGADYGRIAATLEDAAQKRKDLTLDLTA